MGEGDFSGGTERGVLQKYEINFFRQAPAKWRPKFIFSHQMENVVAKWYQLIFPSQRTQKREVIQDVPSDENIPM